MKHILHALVMLFCLNIILSAIQISQSTISGDWSGILVAGSGKLKLILHIKGNPDGTYAGTMDSPDQGANGLLLDTVKLDGSSFFFEIKRIGGSFNGKFENNEIIGEWKQGSASLPLKFNRATTSDLALPKRPQEPTPPYPYVEEEITFKNKSANITLAGTLTLPKTKGPHPVVLLISGSGPQNRNEEVFGHKPFLVMADHLTRQGIAVLRYDDRGVGKSTGDFASATSKDFAGDALSGVKYLKARKDIAKIGIIGHSEGGAIAPMVAVKSADVSFIVMMAGPGVSGEDLMREQRKLIFKTAGMSDEVIITNEKVLSRLYSILKQDNDLTTADAKLRSTLKELSTEIPLLQTPDWMRAIEAEIPRINTPWWRFFILYDPVPALKALKIPVLALNGELDLQVSSKQNLPPIENALKQGGNAKYKIVEIPGLNHLFQTAKTGAVSEYTSIEETIAHSVLNTISVWLKSIVFN